VIAQALRTPRSAALAGVVFALLYGAAVVIVRLAVPDGIVDASAWRTNPMERISTAVHLLAYAGIAFLWFMGVVRSRIGAREDRFLSTVFVGSGTLFLATTFAAGAVASGLVNLHAQVPGGVAGDAAFALGSRVAFELINLYGVRMAGVFMISFGTLGLRTRAMPRWFVGLTYALAAALLLSIGYTLWVTLIFPLWVLALSAFLLVAGLGAETEAPR
jgi:hypothetical protein